MSRYLAEIISPAVLIQDRWRAPRVCDNRSAVLLALPVTALTLLIGAAKWPLYPGAAPDRLLSLTLQGLAALTTPHMLLDRLSSHLVPAGRAAQPQGA